MKQNMEMNYTEHKGEIAYITKENKYVKVIRA